VVTNVLSGNDPGEVSTRTASGTAAGANKAIALKSATNIVSAIFRSRTAAISRSSGLAWSADEDGIIVDTNRDAIDIDSVQNLSVRNSVFNSLTDDAIVLKSSFGLGVFFATQTC
jgi:hypothetical protein